MTEAEWLACTDPRAQLVFLEGNASDRKARLFACGVGRCMLPYLGDERSHQLLAVAEKHADGLANGTELAAAWEGALDASQGAASRTVATLGDPGEWQAARKIVISLQRNQRAADAKDWSGNVLARSRSLLRCVFGNPFQSVTIAPSWLTETVLVIARTIYEDRAFDRMPILADALMDADCDSEDILAHCRNSGPHVRGCWVVDVVLGAK